MGHFDMVRADSDTCDPFSARNIRAGSPEVESNAPTSDHRRRPLYVGDGSTEHEA